MHSLLVLNNVLLWVHSVFHPHKLTPGEQFYEGRSVTQIGRYHIGSTVLLTDLHEHRLQHSLRCAHSQNKLSIDKFASNHNFPLQNAVQSINVEQLTSAGDGIERTVSLGECVVNLKVRTTFG